jgi:hypothetical protein
MKKIKLLFFLFTLGLIAVSCDTKNESEFQMQNGLVLYYGSPAVDGCGWVIRIDKVDYSPMNLDAKFEKDSLKVVVNYQILKSTFICGDGVGRYQQIKITSIKQL